MVLDVVEGAIGAEGDSMEQLTIFDLLPKEGFCENQIINELLDDLRMVFPTQLRDEDYHIWNHVPNLGKRFSVWIEPMDENEDLKWLVDKYKEKSLEVSVYVIPFIRGGEENPWRGHISTMWKTKGHKEI